MTGIIEQIRDEYERAEQIQAQHKRLERAREIKDGVYLNYDGSVIVEGETATYEIRDGACNCPDAKFRVKVHGGYCKHRLATEIALTARAS